MEVVATSASWWNIRDDDEEWEHFFPQIKNIDANKGSVTLRLYDGECSECYIGLDIETNDDEDIYMSFMLENNIDPDEYDYSRYQVRPCFGSWDEALHIATELAMGLKRSHPDTKFRIVYGYGPREELKRIL